MKPLSRQVVRTAFVVGIVAILAGCVEKKRNVNSPARSSERGGEKGGPLDAVDPSGNFGSVQMPVGSLTPNNASTGCFRTVDGWNKYFPMPKLFCGPFATAANTYTNNSNSPWLTVQTCTTNNNTSVKTGIVIADSVNPNDKLCVTNTPSCAQGTNLTINTRSMANGKFYRATVFIQSATLAGLTNVGVDWKYGD